MAISERVPFERRLARELAALYGENEYGKLQEDIYKEPDISGISKAVCLNAIWNFKSGMFEEGLVHASLRWMADGIPMEKWDLSPLVSFDDGYKKGMAKKLAAGVLSLYDDLNELKSDLAKTVLMKGTDIAGHPKERGVFLRLVLDATELTIVRKRDVELELEKIVDIRRNREDGNI